MVPIELEESEDEIMEKIIISGFADEIDPALNKQIEVLKELGISHIEMRGVNGKNLTEYSLKEAAEIKKQLDENGIKLSAVGSPIGKILITDPFEEHFELYKHTVEIAKIMETQFIRMFSFFIPKSEKPEKYREEVMRRMQYFVEYAKEKDIVLLHENEKEIYGDAASRCAELMQQFYCDNFKAVFDFANFVQCKEDTRVAYEQLKPYIGYIHIKDALFEDGQVVPAGEGDGQVRGILADLLKCGYEGVLSLEPHLIDFDGFAELENGAAGKNDTLAGEEAYKKAHSALIKILDQLKVIH